MSRADDATTQPSTALEQLSLDTQRLYRRARVDVVRVKLPTPNWLESINQQQALLQKWGGHLTPEVKQLLMRRQQQLVASMAGGAAPATMPATTQAALPQPVLRSRLVLIATGLIIDTDGHALVPAFIDADELKGDALPVIAGDGRMTIAKLVGSDRPSRLSVLQLASHPSQAATLAVSRPAAGSLVISLSGDGAGRLVIWNPAAPEPGLIVMPDGDIAGFGANGRFMAATAWRPIVSQILATGSVHRAVLGVRVREVSTDDLLRRGDSEVMPTTEPAEIGTSAMQIDAVEPDSVAARAGLQRGDLILTAGGQAVEDTATFAALIATQRGRTELTVLRDQQVRSVTVDLLSPP